MSLFFLESPLLLGTSHHLFVQSILGSENSAGCKKRKVVAKKISPFMKVSSESVIVIPANLLLKPSPLTCVDSSDRMLINAKSECFPDGEFFLESSSKTLNSFVW